MRELVIIGVAGAALVGAFTFYGEKKVTQERARVEQQAIKKDGKAQTARSAAAAKPDGMLSKHCRDCGQSGAVSIVEAGDGIKK
jgi:hypothetical protein